MICDFAILRFCDGGTQFYVHWPVEPFANSQIRKIAKSQKFAKSQKNKIADSQIRKFANEAVMIQTQEQYEITRKQEALFTEAVAKQKERPRPKNVSEILHKATIEALQSMLDDLRAQLSEYRERQKTCNIDLPMMGEDWQ